MNSPIFQKSLRTYSILAFIGMAFHAGELRAATILTMIDDFDDGRTLLDLSGQTGVMEKEQAVSGGSVLGGSRQFLFEVTSNSQGRSARGQIDMFDSNTLGASFGPGVSGRLSVSYEGLSGFGLGGVDLLAEGGNALAFGVTFLDIPATLVAEVTDSAGHRAAMLHELTVGENNVVMLEFDGFDNHAATDFSSIDKIEFSIEGQSAAMDVVVDSFALVSMTVPEPASVPLICAAGLIAMRRRRRAG